MKIPSVHIQLKTTSAYDKALGLIDNKGYAFDKYPRTKILAVPFITMESAEDFKEELSEILKDNKITSTITIAER